MKRIRSGRWGRWSCASLLGLVGLLAAHGPQAAVGSQDRDTPAAAAATAPLETVTLQGGGELAWELQRRPAGWTFGVLRLRGQAVDAPLSEGVLLLRSTKGQERWLPASECRKIDDRTARLTGKVEVEDAKLHFTVDIRLRDDMPAAQIAPHWSIDRDLAGWEMCAISFGTTAAPWKCTLYPFAGNSDKVAIKQLMYCGVPAALLFRSDLSSVALFGLDPAEDYLNPSTWRGSIGFSFQDGSMSPQFRVGGERLAQGVYSLPLQLFLSGAGNSADAVTELVRGWIKVNDYRVEPLFVRSPQEAFDLFLAGRAKSKMWKSGLGYQISGHWPIICPAESPINAYMDYLLYEQTGDPMWRGRAFEQMALFLRAQHTDPEDPHFGAIETNYELEADPKLWYRQWKQFTLPFTGEGVDPELKSGRFNSGDHARCYGFKLDKNAYAARYALLLWQRVQAREGLDQKEWHTAALRIADWIVRHQNPDGGLPMVVDYRPNPDKRWAFSVISGRTLVAMPIIARITGDARYARLAEGLETFLRRQVEGRYWFTGAHVDLWPGDFEADSVWQAVEYWLNKYERTKDPECLKRAEADAWFGFLTWCPKQLSWVNNPTQTCHTEQENFLQYSNYCYQNRKYDCLDRLGKLTGSSVFADLRDRIIQCGFWGQAVSDDWLGGQYERLSDPWLKRAKGINSLGAVYVSQLALEANLQLLEMGWVRAGATKSEQHALKKPE